MSNGLICDSYSNPLFMPHNETEGGTLIMKNIIPRGPSNRNLKTKKMPPKHFNIMNISDTIRAITRSEK